MDRGNAGLSIGDGLNIPMEYPVKYGKRKSENFGTYGRCVYAVKKISYGRRWRWSY